MCVLLRVCALSTISLIQNLGVGEVIEVQDWKMKFIMHLFREVGYLSCITCGWLSDRSAWHIVVVVIDDA